MFFQLLKKKKKILLTDLSTLTPEEIRQSGKELRERIFKILKSHIGQGNAISTVDFFEKLFDVNPETLDVFQRTYWWNVVKTMLRHLRSTEQLFAIVKRGSVFVLQTQIEADKYKLRLDRNIRELASMKDKADRWIQNNRWEKL